MIGKHRFHDSGGGTAFVVRVVPRSTSNEITELAEDGTVCIHLTAPPVEGKTNQQLVQFLSEVFQVHPDRIGIAAGESSGNKIVTVEGLSPFEVERRLFANLRKR
ncbi:MAG: DUF167 domain-containing protein [Anaerolineales bacterium]|nr:DUF167 domain-containing protein [Anaerolineales bacterium]MCS7248951.1 DUF167 domain-containing protein [Anaerolineales bacterium]MDW8162764.1 DUF167 domain-containing protein [Anaerolineales bacterium]MDW8445862.1 DUF167 domain-containing protein [Anaerolineales bacterium]